LKSFPRETTSRPWVTTAGKGSGVTGQAAKLHVWLQIVVTYALLEATLWTSPPAASFSDAVLHRMRVGIGYLQLR
jgi:hypothetical protein